MTQEYEFCPLCATSLVREYRFEAIRSVCPDCEFVHFQDPKVAVIGRPLSQGRVLLVQRAVDPGRGLWALPGGYMDAGEMPDEALRREILEETGIDVEIGELLHIFPMHNISGDVVGIVLAFDVAAIAPGQPLCAGDDVMAARWYAAGDIPANLAFESTRALLEGWQAEKSGS